jgi:hypothetical protein
VTQSAKLTKYGTVQNCYVQNPSKLINAAFAQIAKYRIRQKYRVRNPPKWRSTESDEMDESSICLKIISEESPKLGKYRTTCAEVSLKEKEMTRASSR